MANAYTTFPDSVQRFDLKTDVSSSVYDDWKQFNTYIANGQFANATNLLQSNTELQRCIIDGVYINQLSKTVEEVQDLFLNNIQNYIHETVQYKGLWNATTKYVKYNFVTYDTNGTTQTYECLRDDTPIGMSPINTTYWIPRVIRGEKGEPGIGLSPRGTYSEQTVYYQYDLVLYNDQLWYTIKDNPSGTPNISSVDWRLFFVFDGTNIPYNNSVSQLTSTTVQGALDEVVTDINVLTNSLNTTVNAALATKSNLDHIQTLDKGGTGATNAANARTNLGVAYGTTAGTVCQGNDSRLSDARTPISHNQGANTITAGTFSGQVVAPVGTDYTANRIRNISFTTTDPGVNAASSLVNGSIIFVYE